MERKKDDTKLISLQFLKQIPDSVGPESRHIIRKNEYTTPITSILLSGLIIALLYHSLGFSMEWNFGPVV